jgi:hypothetical protein
MSTVDTQTDTFNMVNLNDVTPAARQPNMASSSPDTSSARTIAEAAAKEWTKAHPQRNHQQSSRRSRRLSPVSRSEFEIARRAAIAIERVSSAIREMRLSDLEIARRSAP